MQIRVFIFRLVFFVYINKEKNIHKINIVITWFKI